MVIHRITEKTLAVIFIAFMAVCGQAYGADWQAGAGEDWQKLLAAARAEGVVAIAGPPELGSRMSEEFTRDTGIKLDYLGGGYRDLATRLGREMASGNLTIDVMLGGINSVLERANEGELMAVKSLLILPSVTDPANWSDGYLKWADDEGKYLAVPAEYVFGWPLLNKDIVPEGTLKSWQDLLKPEFKGKIAAFDPRSQGPGRGEAVYLANLFGADFIRKLYIDQEVKLTRDPRQLVEWVVRGVYPIAIGILPTHVETFRSAGITNLAIGDMADGFGFLAGGSSVPTVPLGAPHPNATAVFLNWYLSDRGQRIYTEIWRSPSRRIDVPKDAAPDYIVPKPGRAYHDSYQEDWVLNVRRKLESEIGKLFDR